MQQVWAVKNMNALFRQRWHFSNKILKPAPWWVGQDTFAPEGDASKTKFFFSVEPPSPRPPVILEAQTH